MTEKRLKGQIALVTGASQGIGAAIAEALAAQGAHVIITARRSDGLEQVEDRIHSAGGSATIAPMDLRDAESIGRLAHAVSERWGKLDMLVLNAAMLGTLTPLNHAEAKEFADVFTLNVSAQQAMIAAFDPLLRKSEQPRLVGITSSVATAPRAFWGVYGASKAAFEVMLSAYAEETRNVGRINVAIIDPGATATKMREKAYPGEDPATLKSPAVVGARVTELLSNGYQTGHRERVEG
jgi:NAD(P)-dependent dehydrogenase (short-subunit alcohol dehydrogenase family)